MINRLIYEKIFLIWASFLGDEEWTIRESVETEMKALNRAYDYRDLVKELKKHEDLEVRRRALRIEKDYFPDLEEFPLFGCYNGKEDDKWKKRFNEHHYQSATYNSVTSETTTVWVCRLTKKEQRDITVNMVTEWLNEGKTLIQVENILKVMIENEKNEKFFTTD